MTTINRLRPLTLLAISAMIGLALLSSCSNEGDAPTLPPEEAFSMDFSGLGEAEDSTAQKTNGYGNWGYSAVGITAWNIVLAAHLSVPVAAYGAALQQTPSYDNGEEKWIWSYDVKPGLIKYTCTLKGQVNGDYVNWEMYISALGSDDFLWYSGSSNLDGTEANWTLNKDLENGTAYLQIDYLNSGDGNASLKYTMIEAADSAVGSYIIYGTSDNTTYNRFYDLYGAQEDNLIQILWHATDRNGRVSSEPKFGTTDFQCWDEALLDVDC